MTGWQKLVRSDELGVMDKLGVRSYELRGIEMKMPKLD